MDKLPHVIRLTLPTLLALQAIRGDFFKNHFYGFIIDLHPQPVVAVKSTIPMLWGNCRQWNSFKIQK